MEKGMDPGAAFTIIIIFISLIIVVVMGIVQMVVLNNIPWSAIITAAWGWWTIRGIIKDEQQKLDDINFINGVG